MMGIRRTPRVVPKKPMGEVAGQLISPYTPIFSALEMCLGPL